MERRQFLKAGCTAAAGLATHACDSPSTSRPNLLYIMTDQHFAGALGCAGNPHVSTPNIDSLAAQGTMFEMAYCSQPICIPCRASMFTSRMPHEVGVPLNNSAMTKPMETWPNLGATLSAAGYDCAYTGKWHIPIPMDRTDIHGFSTIDCVITSKSDEKDDDLPDACRKFLAQPRTQPFFLVASFMNPHDCCQVARGDALPMGAIPDPPPPEECPPLPDNFAIPKNEPEILRHVTHNDPFVHPTWNWADGQWRQYLWSYYRLVEKVDHEIGRLLQALRDSGHEDDTVIYFSADHGDGAASHKWNQKQVLYDESARVPCIISWKGVTPPGRIDRKNPVSATLDLFPTLCDYAGIQPPEGLLGKSLRSFAEGRQPDNRRDYVVTETEFNKWQGKTFGFTGRMVRTTQYKYIVYSEGNHREQFFDMQTDPGEMHSLTRNPAYRDELNQHRHLLAEWISTTNDTFNMTEPV
jgi:arylsulfatase A-like enzyme